jgi:NAD(P)-dependent dehydrogenase (short-subunit alcohol dehydrogenase family)
MAKLTGKIAVITGGSYGLALASARCFIAEGARVVITGRDPGRLERAVTSLGPKARGVQADSSKISDLERLFRSVQEQEGRIDALFVNAGDVEMGGLLGSIDERVARNTLDVNIIGTIFTVQNALPLMNDGASIILTGSAAGSIGSPGTSVYAASKAAIRALARVWAGELADRKIRVNTLSPGLTATGSWEQTPREMQGQLTSMVPMKRVGRSEELATAALFLASDDSSYVTGIELAVDGGLAQL